MRANFLSVTMTLLTLALVSPAWAGPSVRFFPPRFAETTNLSQVAGLKTYAEFVRTELSPLLAKPVKRDPSCGLVSGVRAETRLDQGCGVLVSISPRISNFHVGYEAGRLFTGRSFGWSGVSGDDWSDRRYLIALQQLTQRNFGLPEKSENDRLRAIYRALLGVLSDCDARALGGIEKLPNAEAVISNFLAVFASEIYRASQLDKYPDLPELKKQIRETVGMPWVYLETMLLAAFHGGQHEFLKFYRGNFSPDSYVQMPSPRMGPPRSKHADMSDYWQFSPNLPPMSGIDVSDADIDRMGQLITQYEATHDPETHELTRRNEKFENLAKLLHGGHDNMIRSLALKLTSPRTTAAEASTLVDSIVEFLVQVNNDADRISGIQPIVPLR